MPSRSLTPAVVLVVCIAVGVALLILVPPGGSTDGQTATGRSTEARAEGAVADDTSEGARPGNGDDETVGSVLRWSFDADVDATPRFAVTLEQEMTVEADGEVHEVSTRIEAVLEIELSSEASVGFLKVEEFAVDVESDGDPAELPAVASLLQGLRVELALDPVEGITSDAPIAATNPQVKRMISLIVDVLRQAHPQLAQKSVDVGSSWKNASEWADDDSALEASLARTISVVARTEQTVTLSSELSSSLSGGELSGAGAGRLTTVLDPTSGHLVETSGTVSFEQRTSGVADGRQKQALSLTVSRL